MDGSWDTSQKSWWFFINNMFIDLNDDICLTKEDNMFDQEILDNYVARILNAKYEQVNTNRVCANQKQLKLNQCHKLQNLLAKNKKYLMVLLVPIPTKRSILIYCRAGNWYTTAHTQFLEFMNKHSRKNSNTWLILELLKSVEPQSGPCLASLLSKKLAKSDKSLISFNKCKKCKQYLLPLSTILCNRSWDTSTLQILISWCNIRPLNLRKHPKSSV